MLFGFSENDGGRLTNWYNREVIEIVNKKKKMVRVKWDQLCLGKNDSETIEQLLPTKWNSKSTKPSAWWQYFTYTVH